MGKLVCSLLGVVVLKTRVQRLFLLLAGLALAGGIGYEYWFGKRELHPTNRYYILFGEQPFGVPYPWFNADNVHAHDAYERNCGSRSRVNYRRVNMCVDDLLRPDLRALHKKFSALVDADFKRYWDAQRWKALKAVVYAGFAWLSVFFAFCAVRWVARGQA